MPIQSRPYTGLDDLQKMKDLLAEIKRVYPYSSYHPGDMDWWTFYIDNQRDLSRCIRLWEDERLIAWTYWIEGEAIFDTAIHPDFRGSAEERRILAEMERHVTEFVRSQPDMERQIFTHAHADEEARIAILESRGFKGEDEITSLAHDITGDLPLSSLPAGYNFLDSMRPEYAGKRADVHGSAFRSTRMTADYYRHFMTAPGYDPALDTVIVAPDGRFAAFAMGWASQRVGLLEPVGTRTDFQRKGLGRAAVLEGLRRLRQRGIETVIVNTANEPAHIAFYESAGFRIVNRIRQYVKPIIE